MIFIDQNSLFAHFSFIFVQKNSWMDKKVWWKLTLKMQMLAVESLQNLDPEFFLFGQRFQKILSPLSTSKKPSVGSKGSSKQMSNPGKVEFCFVEKPNLKPIRMTNKKHSLNLGILLFKPGTVISTRYWWNILCN